MSITHTHTPTWGVCADLWERISGYTECTTHILKVSRRSFLCVSWKSYHPNDFACSLIHHCCLPEWVSWTRHPFLDYPLAFQVLPFCRFQKHSCNHLAPSSLLSPSSLCLCSFRTAITAITKAVARQETGRLASLSVGRSVRSIHPHSSLFALFDFKIFLLCH